MNRIKYLAIIVAGVVVVTGLSYFIGSFILN